MGFTGIMTPTVIFRLSYQCRSRLLGAQSKHAGQYVGLGLYHARSVVITNSQLPPTQHSHLQRSTPPIKSPKRLLTQRPKEEYALPTRGVLSLLPSTWVPYAELIRLNKPAGTFYLFFPCFFSTLLAAPLTAPIVTPVSVLQTSLLFLGGAMVMRGVGCTINDIWDRRFDPLVHRTRWRPVARGAVTPLQALTFSGVQLFTGLVILLQFPNPCLYYGIPSLILVAAYPLAKRVTHYPQFVLGLTFSWGAMMGFPALGIDLVHNGAALTAAAMLYSSNIAWTVLYDMIYAHMDVKDDAKAGIKSIAVRHLAQTKQVLTGLAMAQVSLLAAAGIAAGVGPLFFAGSCGGTAVTLAIMIKNVRLEQSESCWWWFSHGCWITGGVISAGMAADYLLRYSQSTEEVTVEAQPG